jgi:hypothetical protein
MNSMVPADQCWENVTPSGALDAVDLELFQENVSLSYCGVVGSGGVTISNSVEIQLASTGYLLNQLTNGDAGGVVPLAPGVYPIGDERIPGETLCGVPDGGQAVLVSYNSNDGGVLWALTGSVTIASIYDAGLAGSFDVILGDWSNGSPPTVYDAGRLTGTFSVSACPGTN